MASARSPRSRAPGAGGTGNRHPGRVRTEARSDEEGYPGQEAQTVRYQPFSLPSGASLTVEPGGQLELSSAPAATLGELVEVTGRDLAALRDAAAAAGLELCGYGLDPLRPPRRLLDLPRYAAMEEFFDREGPWGRQMMCGTASVQVCVDAGDDSARPVRVPLALADAARHRAGAGGRVRQLPAAGRQADRLAFGPAAGVVQHGSGADPGSRAWTRPTATRATPGPPTRWTRSSCASASLARRTGPRRPG